MLSLSHLQYFAKAAELSSIARAAEVLHVTPSAISQAIVALERQLDAQLTSHRRNTFELTATGKVLADKARALLVIAASVENDIHLAEGRDEGTVNFMTHQSIASTMLPDILQQFLRRYPSIKPEIQIGVREQITAALTKGTTSFGITVDLKGSDNDDFDSKTLFKGHYVLAGRSRRADVGKQTFLISDSRTPEIETLRHLYLKKYRRELPVAFSLKSWTVSAEMAAAGVGLAFVPDYVLARVDKRRLQTLPWPFSTPPPAYAISAIWPRGATLCGCSQRFIDHLGQTIADGPPAST